jgi:hypothetical protein
MIEWKVTGQKPDFNRDGVLLPPVAPSYILIRTETDELIHGSLTEILPTQEKVRQILWKIRQKTDETLN